MVICSIVMMIMCGVMFYGTFQFPNLSVSGIGPEVFPRIILVIAFCLSLALFVESRGRKSELETLKLNKKQVCVAMSIILYIVLLKRIGFIASSLLFMIMCSFSIKPRLELKNIMIITSVGVMTVAAVYYIFAVVLTLFLP